MPKSKPVSAIALLMEDHEYVKKAFRAFEKMDDEDQPALCARRSRTRT